MQDDWGYVDIQTGKSASETLKSLKDLECQLIIDSGNVTNRILIKDN